MLTQQRRNGAVQRAPARATVSSIINAANELYSKRALWEKPFFGGKTQNEIIEELSVRKNKNETKSKEKSSKSKVTMGKMSQAPSYISAPVGLGSKAGQIGMRLMGNPQKLTDVSGGNSFEGVRVAFTDVMTTMVQTPVAAAPIATAGAALYRCLWDGLSYKNYHYIAPRALSPNLLERISALYEFYAFREVTLEFVPYDSTATRGAIAIGFERDMGAFDPSMFGLSYVMQTEGSTSSSIWRPARATLRFNGTKVFKTMIGLPEGDSLDPSSLNDTVQALCLVGVGGVDVTALVSHGYIRVSGVLDLYRGTSAYRSGTLSVTAPLVQEVESSLNKRLYLEWERDYFSHKLSYREWIKKHKKDFFTRAKSDLISQLAKTDEKKDE